MAIPFFSRSAPKLVLPSVLTCTTHACGSSHNVVLWSQKHLSSHSAQHHWALLHSLALQSALRPNHQRDLCRFHLLARVTTATIQYMCLSVPWLICARLQVMSPRISLKRTLLCWSNWCTSTDRVWRRLMIQLRAFRRTLLNRIWMMSKYEICWLHRCTYGRERSICRPITSLSLLQTKLRVKFISLPRKCRETCRNALTQKKVESRNTFRQRRHFLRTSTS